MQIPKFWAAAAGSGAGSQGEPLFRRAWGWSMTSAAEALSVAQERLTSILDGLRTGEKVGGYYPRVPLREPIVDELLVDGEQALVVTRNRYGAEVLNTDRVLIADVDITDLAAPAGGGLLRRLFRRAAPSDHEMGEPVVVQERLEAIAQWAGRNPAYGVRIYRTAFGLRVFVTGVADPASSSDGERILRELDADPIYRELCRAHGTFRARLTPKPWRLPRTSAPRDRWPFEDYRTEQGFQHWLAGYDAAAQGYAVCRHLATHGAYPSTMEQLIIERHDQRTGASASLPLA